MIFRLIFHLKKQKIEPALGRCRLRNAIFCSIITIAGFTIFVGGHAEFFFEKCVEL